MQNLKVTYFYFSVHCEIESFCHSVVSFVIPLTLAHEVPLSMEFSRQEYWSRLSFPSPRDHRDPEIKPGSLALQADSLPSEPPGNFWLIFILFTP